MELSESDKSTIGNALRTVKTKAVADHLGLKFVAHGAGHSIFNDASEHQIPQEVKIPHWLVDRIHAAGMR